MKLNYHLFAAGSSLSLLALLMAGCSQPQIEMKPGSALKGSGKMGMAKKMGAEPKPASGAAPSVPATAGDEPKATGDEPKATGDAPKATGG